ncbi:MAG: DVU_1551 family NTP transferase [Terracidiphilus sp.]
MSSAIQPGTTNSGGSRLAAIVLAAGYSSRMMAFKPLLRLGDGTAFERCIHSLRTAGIGEVIAVLGHRADELRPLAKRCGARCVINSQFDHGMYSSIVAGSRAIPEWAEAAFVLPADIPLVRSSTVRQLAAAWAACRSGIVYPVFDALRGHPPLIGKQILDEAAQEGAEGPLSALLASHENEAVELPVADEAIHMDMDTQADYEALAGLVTHRDIPSGAECRAILAEFHVGARVVRHSRKVAEVAGRIAGALFCSGHDVNRELVQAGALLHDLAKGQPKHAAIGAAILCKMDFDRVAEIVAVHTDLGEFVRLDEKAIVYLADKLVCGDQLITLKQRFAPAFTRFKKDRAALEAARRRLQNAKRVARALEMRLGSTLESIVCEDASSRTRFHNKLRTDEVGTR